MSVLIDKKYNWQHLRNDSLVCWYVGSVSAVNQLLTFLEEYPDADLNNLRGKLFDLYSNFAFIVSMNDKIIAAVDKIRSYPVFYCHEGNNFGVSNSARLLMDRFQICKQNEISLLEFYMAGYVTGRDTVYEGLYQLQAGEFLIHENKGGAFSQERYYKYVPTASRYEEECDLVEELAAITDDIFKGLICDIGDAPVWVPLSGGLDSRLILCKLMELGCERITAFSYGSPGNFEAKAARIVAERVGVPWTFLPQTWAGSHRFFHSSLRKRYWQFCDGLCSVPNMQDVETLAFLRQRDEIPDDAVFINGQSGDFITGGHIPETLVSGVSSLDDLYHTIIEKHYSLWRHVRAPENLRIIREKIGRLLDLKKETREKSEALYGLFEWWEWQERQSKYVVNGQRSYDFFGFGWRLPLWDGRYLRFWEKIPLGLKCGQRLYRRYLEGYNYKGLFKDFVPNIWRWPGASLMVIPLAKLVQWLLGDHFKQGFYRYASYIGHYRPLYAGYSPLYFIKRAGLSRNPVSFFVETWLEENGLSVESKIVP